ncbi:MAG: dephospho-CoA kinase [Lentisphaeria bacterium]|nr:dephospho-CoA kinase [Lentisphaeria bacterium]
MAEIIGVTGGMGAGKSTVLTILADLGCRTLDSDTVVHQLYGPGRELVNVFVNRWGEHARDENGGVCRPTVAREVFERPDELSWLNSQVHPAVKRVIVKEAARCSRHLFCAIPLLYEAGWERDVYCVWAVWCDKETQHRRLSARGLTPREITQRLDNQISMDEKLRRADGGLINTGSRESLKKQILRLLERLPPSP